MSKYIKLPHLDYSRIIHAAKSTVKFGCKYKTQICGGAACVLLLDDIRERIGRKKDRTKYAKNDLKHQEIERKHEGEIKVLIKKANQCEEAQKKVAVLEKIVQNTVSDRGNRE